MPEYKYNNIQLDIQNNSECVQPTIEKKGVCSRLADVSHLVVLELIPNVALFGTLSRWVVNRGLRK